MPLADTSYAILRAIKEPVFGETPVAGNPTTLRYKSEGLNYDISKTASAEINADRTVSKMIATSAKSGGPVTMEMRAIGLEPFLETVMQSTFTEFGVGGVGAETLTATITANTITAAAATAGASLFTLLQPGQWFRLIGYGANNGKILRVSSAAAPTDTTLTLDPGTPAAISAGETIQIQSARLTHGSQINSWTIEKEQSDIGVFIAYRGQTTDKFSMKVAAGSLTDITFEFVGKDGFESDTTTLPGVPVEADTFDIHSGVAGATNAIWMDGAPVAGTYVKSVDFSYSNSLRARDAIGTLGAVSIGTGDIECTVNLQIYFKDKSTFTKYRQNSNLSISFATTDDEGNGYIITMPACNISGWKSPTSAKSQDQMVDLSLTALGDKGNAVPALRRAVFIDRVGVGA